MHKKKVIIIGAGIAGLSTAIYLSQSGFNVEIFEMNDRCGGLCTTWNRKGYSFESCLYWVFGTNKYNSFNKIWKELGIMDSLKFLHFNNFMELKDASDGTNFDLWSDLRKLASEMKKYGTNKDQKEIDKLLACAKRIGKFNMYIDKPRELFGIMDYIKLIKSYVPYIDLFIKYSNKSLETYCNVFESEKLRQILLDFMHHIDNYPLILILLIFSYMDCNNAEYPVGGSYKLSKTLESRAKELGVKIKYNSKVTKIITENNSAVGIALDNLKETRGDYIVSAGDGKNTIFNLLEGKYTTRKIIRQYKKLPVFLSYMQVSFGVNKDLSDTMQFILYKLSNKIKIGNDIIEQFRIRHYCFNKEFSPCGKSSLIVTFKADYEYWNNIYEKDFSKYNCEKKKVADIVLKEIENIYGSLKEYIEVVDVATPKTFQVKTMNNKGSAEGWYTNCNTFYEKFPYRIKGLGNFYMAGHWTNINGGITFAALSGRDVAQIICNDEKVNFKV